MALSAAAVGVAVTQLFVSNFVGMAFACLLVAAGAGAILWRRRHSLSGQMFGLILGFVVIAATGAGIAADRTLKTAGNTQVSAHGATASPSPSNVMPTKWSPVEPDSCRPDGNFTSPLTNAYADESTQVRGNANLCADQMLWVLIQEGENVWVQGKQAMTVSNGTWSSATPAKMCAKHCAKQAIFILVATGPEGSGSIKMTLRNTAQSDGAKLPEVPLNATTLDRAEVFFK